MRAEIISVGTELLLGDIVNTNAQYLARQLAALGYSVYYQTVVGDNANRLRDLVLEAKSRSDILLFTGGLGPTDDDLTKETVASVFGDTLVPDVDEMIKLETFFKRRGVTMTENNRKQALVPRNGRKLENREGTAPGVFFRQGNKYAILLPGPPREMVPMFTEQVVPLLEAMQDSVIRSVTLRVFGIGESTLEEKIHPLLSGTNPTAGLYAKTGEVHIRITAKAHTAEQADSMCDEYASLFHIALGDLIYSSNGDDPETTVVKLLAGQGKTIATAESCTGGMLGQRITAVPGASEVYGFGAITYSNDAKHSTLGVRSSTLRRHGAISSQAAAEMAFGAAKRADADFGVGITGIAGPGGGTAEKPVGLVYVAVAYQNQVTVKKLNAGSRGRDYVREYATGHALDMLRRLLTGLPVADAKTFTRTQEADFEREGRPKRRSGLLGRFVATFLLVVLLFLLLVGGAYLSRLTRKATDETPANSNPSPSAQGLVYGTMEYTAAANRYVAHENERSPAVKGMVAMPGGMLEALVTQSSTPQNGLLAATGSQPESNAIGSDARVATGGTNVLVAGGSPFTPLLSLTNTEESPRLTTFTYFTSRDAKVYHIFAVYLGDDSELEATGFQPGQADLSSYSHFLDFFLGTKVRSLYDMPIDVVQGDSFITLAVNDPDTQGRRLYLCGRLQRNNEPALPLSFRFGPGTPLMPAAWYQEQGTPPPDAGALYAGWLRWYLNRQVDNAALQLAAGMPEKDLSPVETDAPATAAAETASSSSSGSSSSASASSSNTSSSASNQSTSIPGLPAALPHNKGTPMAIMAATGSSNSSSSSSSSGSSSSGSSSSGAVSSGQGSSSGDAASPADESASSDEGSSSSSRQQTTAPQPETPTPRRPDPTQLTVTMNGQLVTAPTEEILAQICQNEAAGMQRSAIQALAICAHSWILNQQGSGHAAPEVTGRPASLQVLSAVREVVNLVVSADDQNPAFTPWFAMAAQATNSAQNVWGKSRSYLVGVPSPHDQGQEGWRQIFTISPDELAAMAKTGLGIDLTTAGQPSVWAGSSKKNDGGYVETMLLAGKEFTGVQIWQALVQNGRVLLPSPAFDVEFDGENFVFYCYGAGHGCGLSLSGMAHYAANGWGYERILSHYFPDTKLLQWQ